MMILEMLNDPHGLTLTIVAVTVVFSALLILYGLYSLSGAIFTGKLQRKKRKPSGNPDPETAAVIALALDRCLSDDDTEEVAAVIATALHMYLSQSVHDYEPGFITIRRDLPSSWSDKSLNLRKKPLTK